VIDARAARNEPEDFRRRLARKGAADSFDAWLAADERWRELVPRVDELRSRTKAKGKPTPEQLEELRGIKEELQSAEQELAQAEAVRDEVGLRIPNPPADEVPDGATEDDVREVFEESGELEDAESGLLRDVRLFHASVIEGVEAAIETITGDIAAGVLGRELQLAPADIDAIVDRALQRYLADEPLRVRVHPDEAVGLSCGVPVVGDERLRYGDAVIELRCGSVDATLGVRFASVLRAARA
jgi:seryl-tRNA synthetase